MNKCLYDNKQIRKLNYSFLFFLLPSFKVSPNEIDQKKRVLRGFSENQQMNRIT